jgi:hypothetical protein
VPRLYKRKRVPILNSSGDYDGTSYVDIPVIAEMNIVGSGGQEFHYRFYNDSTTQLRTVNVKKVGSATGSFGNANVSLAKYVNAERILTMAFSNPVELSTFMGKPMLGNYAWRTDKKFKNLDPAPKQPDGSDDPRHKQVHYVRYYKNNNLNSEIWIDVELIDEIDLLATNAQEYGFKLKNPTNDDYAAMGGAGFGIQRTDDNDPYQPYVGYCDPSLELLDVEYGDDDKPVPARLDPFQNIVNVFGESLTIFWAFKPEVLGLESPSAMTGYHFRLQTGGTAAPPMNITLSDGRHGVVTGNFPTVSDVVTVTQGVVTGIAFLAFPWWIVGPNTDNSSPSGINHYEQPDGTFTHTWPFFGYTYTFAIPPAHFVPAGSLSVSFGPVTLTVEGVEWTLTNIHVAFTAVPESDFGASPNSMDFNPFFSATFTP